MKKILQDAYVEAKKAHKGIWLAAVVVPGGFVGITVYLAGRTAYKNFKKKEKKDDRGEDS
ncbi:MAG: hypothetical protein HC840_00690 [Leptolyngbyaceae cyanobacterium RM2_2_4]|nr:hypothetical protein [Leptolyngbyaceae cyanobacterium RM2_2_4]